MFILIIVLKRSIKNRLSATNSRWDHVCFACTEWQTKLQTALMEVSIVTIYLNLKSKRGMPIIRQHYSIDHNIVLIDMGDYGGGEGGGNVLLYVGCVLWRGGHRGRSIQVAVPRGSGVTGKGSRRCCWTPCSWTPRQRLAPERRRPGPAASAPGTAGTLASPVRRICSRVSAPFHLRQHCWKTACRVTFNNKLFVYLHNNIVPL